jgi:hypothetical protein
MTLAAVANPITQFFDTDGSPLDAGYLYFGLANQNPETNPQTVYWDEDGTQPAAQPIRTVNGYPSRAGTPAAIYSISGFSLTVRNKRGGLVLTFGDVTSTGVANFMQTFLSASTTADARAAIGAAESGANSSITSLSGVGAIAGFRNRARNGGCRISQEGTIASVAGIYTYGGADGFCSSVNGTLDSGNISQLTTGPSVGVQGFSHGFTNLTVSTGGSILHQHRMSYLDTFDMSGKQVTISCKAYQDTGSTITTAQLSLIKPTASVDTFSAQTTLQTSGNITIPSGVLTPLTFTTTALGASDASLGLAAALYIPFASAITTKNFTITDLQVEIGTAASTFEFVDIATDLQRCKRTLQCFPVGSIDFIGSNQSAGANNSYTMPMKVSMRATPTSISGSYTLVNCSGPSTLTTTADNVVLNVPNTAAGAWRLTNSTIAKIRCDL